MRVQRNVPKAMMSLQPPKLMPKPSQKRVADVVLAEVVTVRKRALMQLLKRQHLPKPKHLQFQKLCRKPMPSQSAVAAPRSMPSRLKPQPTRQQRLLRRLLQR